MKYPKLIQSSLFVALALSGLMACERENDLETTDRTSVVAFKVATGYTPETRTSFSGDVTGTSSTHERIDWTDGDRFRVYSAEAETEASAHTADYTVSAHETDGSNSVATVSSASPLKWADGTNTFYGFYPAPTDENGATMAENVVTGSILPSQEVTLSNGIYVADLENRGYMYAVAASSLSVSNAVSLVFQPLMTTFEFHLRSSSDLPTTGKLTTIKLTSTQTDAYLTGHFTATLASDGTYSLSVTDDATRSNEIEVTLPEGGVALSEENDLQVTLLGLSLPQSMLTLELTFDDGLTRYLDLKDDDDNWITVPAGMKLYVNNAGVPGFEYVLEVNSTSMVMNADGTTETALKIKSAKTAGSLTLPVDWKAQIQVGGEWVDLADVSPEQWPDWLPADFPASGSPSTIEFENLTDVKMTAQPVMSHEERLRTAWTDEIEAAYRNPSNLFPEARLDLSKWNFVAHRLENRTTANCYIVQGPGKYMFPMVYGNAVDLTCFNTSDYKPSYEPSVSGAGVLNQFRNHVRNALDYEWTVTPYRIKQPWVSRDANFGANCTEVGILWQDFDGDVITNLATVEEFTYLNGKTDRFILFDIPAESIKPGNAIIYVKDTGLTDESGEGHPIAWSWHIWITDQNMYPIKMKNNSNSAGFPVQPVNLGWVDGSEGLFYPERSAQVRFVSAECTDAYKDVTMTQEEYERMSTSGHAPFYQWGRKDPLQANATAVTGELHHVYYSVRHPEVFLGQHTGIISQFDWTDNGYRNLWKAENKKYGMTNRTATTGRKTVYDPCPRGYAMAPGTTWDDVYKEESQWTGSGWIIPSGMGDDRKTFFPAAGYLRIENPSGLESAHYLGLQNEGSKGYYWTDFPVFIGSYRESYGLKFENDESSFTVGDMMRAYGCSVRCVREDQYTDAKEGGEAPVYIEDEPEDVPDDNSYDIIFYTAEKVRDNITSLDEANEIILHESLEFVTENPFTVSPALSVWFGSNDENLRNQVNLEAGATLSIALSDKGKVTASQIIVNCLSTETNATLNVNGLGAKSIYNAGEPTLVSYDISPASTITSISLTANKQTAIYSITVVFNPE